MRTAFFAGLDVDWLDLTTVGDATDRDGTLADPADLDYPAASSGASSPTRSSPRSAT